MRRRIVMLTAAGALLAVTLLALPLGIVARRSYVRDARVRLLQAASTGAAQVRGDLASARLPASLDGGRITQALVDAQGRRTAGTAAAGNDTLVRDALTGRQSSAVDGQAITVATPVTDGDQVVAALVVRADLAGVRQRQRRTWLALAAMCAAAVLAAATAAWLVARAVVRPIEELVRTGRRIGDGDLTARAAPSHIREIDELVAVLNGSVARVEEMVQRERAFSREVAHQLRTPLSSLSLQLDAAAAAARAASEAGEVAQRVDDARTAAGRVRAVVDDVIGLARGLTPDEETPVTAMLEHAVSWQERLASVQRPLRTHSAVPTSTVLAMDPAAARQVLDVLLDNALAHGRGAITVEASFRSAESESPGGRLVAVTVRDEGRLGTEAWQVFAIGDRERGHGIGLPYARRLAEAEGARVVLDAEEPTSFALVVQEVPRESARGSGPAGSHHERSIPDDGQNARRTRRDSGRPSGS